LSETRLAGIDAGGTLIKVAAENADGMIFRSFSASDPGTCIQWISSHLKGATLCFTGGAANRLKTELGHVESRVIPEFDASCRGIRYLLRQQKEPVPDRFILTNCGTGTSIHRVDPSGQTRAGGSGIGGGTLVGLSELLTGESDFASLMRLAAHGSRNQVDLTVAHIYEGSQPPIPGDLTASHFGRVITNSAAITSGDKVAAVIGMVAEAVTSLTLFAAKEEGLRTAVFIGSTFADNPIMQKTVKRYCTFFSLEPIIPENGRFSGAIGACLAIQNK
jgi:Pantothenate kinase, acetyl-CoA regulated